MIEFSDEHEAFRAVVRDFAQRELAPHVERWEAAAELPLEAVAKMAELGVFAIVFPEEWGGSGGDFTCLLYTSPSPRDRTRSRMPSSA